MHDGRERTRDMVASGWSDEAHVNAAQAAVTRAMAETNHVGIHGMLSSARASLEHALDPTTEDRLKWIVDADAKVATALGEYHAQTGGCDRAT